MKKRIAIICGGPSAEHEVSLQSGLNVLAAMDKERYEPVFFAVSKQGKFYAGNQSELVINQADPRLIALDTTNGREIVFLPGGQGEFLFLDDSSRASADAVFPIIHGTMGEDGSLQGLLRSCAIPFVGADVIGSAVGMDKDVMKRLLRDAGLPIGKFIAMRDNDRLPFSQVSEVLGLPLFVKPANLGSSVGVSKVSDESGYEAAIEAAFAHDAKIILEEAIVGREIECSVLGGKMPRASAVGEVRVKKDFYSYEAKYLDDAAAELIIPAELKERELRLAQELAIKTFKTLECRGLGRVDMFLCPDGRIIINEINTLPGFTKNSMYPKLWEQSGIGYTELISLPLDEALGR